MRRAAIIPKLLISRQMNGRGCLPWDTISAHVCSSRVLKNGFSGIYDRFGPDALQTMLETLFFPTMAPIFVNRPLTPQEQSVSGTTRITCSEQAPPSISLRQYTIRPIVPDRVIRVHPGTATERKP